MLSATRLKLPAFRAKPSPIPYGIAPSPILSLRVADLNTVAKISGTSLQMIAQHYGKLRQDVARDALARLAL